MNDLDSRVTLDSIAEIPEFENVAQEWPGVPPLAFSDDEEDVLAEYTVSGIESPSSS